MVNMGGCFAGDRRVDVVVPHVCIRRSNRVLGRERDHARVDTRREGGGTKTGDPGGERRDATSEGRISLSRHTPYYQNARIMYHLAVF